MVRNVLSVAALWYGSSLELSQGSQVMRVLQSLSDQGNLSNLTSFINNAVLLIVAATHVINLTRSALAGDAGERQSSFMAVHPFCVSATLACNYMPGWYLGA